jgi:hypothetical protein
MLLWRVFPYLASAADQRAPGHPLYVHPDQGDGRWDNPRLFLVGYYALTPTAAIVETFQSVTRWSPEMLPFPQISGASRSLGVYRLDEEQFPLLDLDDARTLLDWNLRPTQVVVRNRPFTQDLAARIVAEQRWVGLRWWSLHRPQLTLVALWDRSDLTVEAVEQLPGHPALRDAAAMLARRTF